jgi:hypothetical protein
VYNNKQYISKIDEHGGGGKSRGDWVVFEDGTITNYFSLLTKSLFYSKFKGNIQIYVLKNLLTFEQNLC